MKIHSTLLFIGLSRLLFTSWTRATSIAKKPALLVFALVTLLARGVALSAPEGFNPGPDIITGEIGEIGGLAQFGSNGSQVGLGVSTTSCNAGNVPVNFFAMPDTSHPIIPHNLYRMSGGSGNNDRFEQIGQSWVKHAFGADQLDACFVCTPGDFTHLGVGCSDTYSSDENADQSLLGSRALINPFTGVFQSTANNHTGHIHNGTSHRILVEGSDLNTTLNPGATYYVEVQYISSDEYAWCQVHPGQCNMYNNASYRQFTVSGTTSFTFLSVGNTVRMTAAINAWTGATINPIEPEPGVDGRASIAYKVTGPVAGLYHYEYAIYNENLDRAIQSFSVPLGCEIALSNLGFHAPLNHPGFPNDGTLGDAGFSNAAWTSNQTTSALMWSTEAFAQNQNANAIRWGTLYNFRFDSDRAPLFTQATIGFFKTGAPVTVGILGPNACNVTPSPTPTATATATATASPTPTVPPTPSPTPTPVPTPILPPAGNGKIVFVRSDEIYVMDADGSNPTNLTNNPALDDAPKWSPDGTKIAFTSTRGGQPYHPHIYVMNANGSNPIRLTANPGTDYEYNLSWSPDGTKIAFARLTSTGVDIYVINANGTNQTRLTNTSNYNYQPAWSPDGGKIAFSGGRGGSVQIHVIDVNGSNDTTLTDEAYAQNPAWSPDGTKIAYSTGEIRVMSAYGTNRTYLTSSGTNDSPAWSPDGTKIAFSSAPDGNAEIYVMDANGANQTNITNNPVSDSSPDWQRIALPPPPAAQAINLSTRMLVQSGDNVPDALADPVLELHGSGAFVTITDDNWRDDPVQEAAIIFTGIPPTNDLEAAIDATLNPGAYTAIVRGKNDTSGVALVEVYDLNQAAPAKLGNISTRAFVSTGDNIVIAGFVLGNNSGDDSVVVRGIGPSLTAVGVPNVLADPTLELRDSNGALLIADNDWQDDPTQAADLIAAGLAPSSTLESGIAATLSPGLYTALLAGVNGGSGVGAVEVYDLGL